MMLPKDLLNDLEKGDRVAVFLEAPDELEHNSYRFFTSGLLNQLSQQQFQQMAPATASGGNLGQIGQALGGLWR